jgi:hypothetical protein
MMTLSVAGLVMGCDDKPKDASTATQPAPSASASASATASSVPLAAAPASATASAAAPTASASVPGASASAAMATGSTPPKPSAPVSKQIAGANYILDVSAPGNCKAQASCTMTLKLQAQNPFHINKDYPYKFVADASPGLDVSKGDFRRESDLAGVMTVAFTSQSAGNAKVAGTYKMSVCSDDKCLIETPRVELTVPIVQ